MNMHELPMIIFTVLAQISVGAFLILGIAQVWLSAKTDEATADRLTIPILYVIGPTLVLGLIASMFHMNDITNTLNVIRNWQTSWLSREILFGVGFAAVGFLFALMQWFRIGSRTLRMVIGAIAALLGIGLLYSMSMIYASVPTVPAWNYWTTPAMFFIGAIMLGAAAVATGQLLTAAVRNNTEKTTTNDDTIITGETTPPTTTSGTTADTNNGSLMTKLRISETKEEINAPMRDEEWTLLRSMVQGLAILAAAAGAILLVTYIFHIINLGQPAPGAQAASTQAAAVYTGAFFIIRLLLLALAAIVLAFFVFKAAGTAVRDNPTPLATMALISFILMVIGELMGRSLHYDSLFRIGL